MKTPQQLLEEHLPDFAKMTQEEAIEYARKQIEIAKAAQSQEKDPKAEFMKMVEGIKERAKKLSQR